MTTVYFRVTLSISDRRLGVTERSNLCKELCAGLLVADRTFFFAHVGVAGASRASHFVLFEVDRTTTRHVVVYDSIAGFAEEHGHVSTVVRALAQYTRSEWTFDMPPCSQQTDGMYVILR